MRHHRRRMAGMVAGYASRHIYGPDIEYDRHRRRPVLRPPSVRFLVLFPPRFFAGPFPARLVFYAKTDCEGNLMDTKVVVITGASSGIGAALARLLGSQGHKIAIAARREKELQEVAADSGTDALPIIADVTRREHVERLRDAALEKFDTIDVWVNNAGQAITRSVLELTDDDVDHIIGVNVKSALYGMQAIVPYFQKQGRGHLINTSSFLGVVPLVPFRSIYSAAKAALNSLTAAVRMELRAKSPDIHVSLVMPGMVMNDFGKHALYGTPEFPSGGRRPMPGQTSEEVASLIAGLLDHPQSELYTNPATLEIAKRYRENVDAFEEGMLQRT
jgi:short-subunit dehydrogenase